MIWLLLLIPIGLLLLMIISAAFIYGKLGFPMWSAFVPLYNTWVLVDGMCGRFDAIGAIAAPVLGWILTFIGRDNSVLIQVGSILSIAGTVVSGIAFYKAVRYLGHGVGFFLGCLFLPFIFLPILAFER